MREDFLPTRVLPELTADNTFFWTSGADGVLRVLRCEECGYYNHPPYPRCSRCLSERVVPQPVSGDGTVYSFTVNHQQWLPGLPPYVIAIIELDEQPLLRIFSNLVDVDPDEVAIGDRVQVDFRQSGDVWLPQFRKAST